MVPIPAQACNCVCHLFLRKPERGDLDVAILFKVVQTTKNTESDYFFIFFLFFFFLNVALKSSNIQIFLWLLTHFILSRVTDFGYETKKIISLKWQHF